MVTAAAAAADEGGLAAWPAVGAANTDVKLDDDEFGDAMVRALW